MVHNDKGDAGALPDGWVAAPVSQVGDLLRGVSYKKAVARETPAEGYLPVLRATNIQDARLILDSQLVFVPEKYVKPEQKLEPGDVVICMSSGSKHLVGKTAQLTQVWDGSFGAFCAAVRFHSALDQRFAGYFFGSPRYRHLVRERSSGVNINNLRRGDIETLLFPIPPLAEQHRIAAEIETQFTRLEAGVTALKRAQANLRRYKASVLKAACEGRLVPTEAELARAEDRDYEPAKVLLQRILTERRVTWEAENPHKKYKEPALPDTSDLPEVPEGWVWATTEQLAAPKKYSLAIGPFGSNLLVKDYRDEGVPLVFVRNIRTGVFDSPDTRYITPEKAQELHAHQVEPGDVLITKMGDPPGDACQYPIVRPPAIITSDCIKWTLSSLLSENLYFVHAVNSQSVHVQILGITRGVAQRKVSLGRFKGIAIPLPPLSEQHRIVAEVERRLSVVQELEKQVEAALRRAERLRQAILKHAFEGKLVPQDPEDEPASELLARIRAQRSARQPTNKQPRQIPLPIP